MDVDVRPGSLSFNYWDEFDDDDRSYPVIPFKWPCVLANCMLKLPLDDCTNLPHIYSKEYLWEVALFCLGESALPRNDNTKVLVLGSSGVSEFNECQAFISENPPLSSENVNVASKAVSNLMDEMTQMKHL